MLRIAAPLLAIALVLPSCAGFKAATPISVEALRTAPAAADVGYTNAVGVPSLAERMASRKDLKLAVLQVAYSVQGRPEMNFTTDIWSFGGVTTWKSTTTPEVQVPTSFAVAAALHATKQLEQALAASGFAVIPHNLVAGTKAYAKHYGDYPTGFSMESSSFAVVSAPPMRVKPATGMIAFGQLHLVWPDAEALREIRTELGEDVLFLCVKYQTTTMRGLSGNLISSAAINVVDPEFVGYGIGGFGHHVTALDATTLQDGAPVPGFIEHLSAKQFKVNWTPVFQDLSRVHTAFAAGAAKGLHGLAYPPVAK